MGYQPPEVNNLNTPTPTGLNDYVWQTQVAVVEICLLYTSPSPRDTR